MPRDMHPVPIGVTRELVLAAWELLQWDPEEWEAAGLAQQRQRDVPQAQWKHPLVMAASSIGTAAAEARRASASSTESGENRSTSRSRVAVEAVVAMGAAAAQDAMHIEAAFRARVTIARHKGLEGRVTSAWATVGVACGQQLNVPRIYRGHLHRHPADSPVIRRQWRKALDLESAN